MCRFSIAIAVSLVPMLGAAEGLLGVWTPQSAGASSGSTEAGAEPPVAIVRPNGCDPPGMPAMLDTELPIEFVDAGDRILMRFEEWADERTIYMDPGSPPAVQEPSALGVSFGRFRGETLEVFTLYLDDPTFDARGTPLSDAATVLERYTPSESAAHLDYEVTVTDAATFARPVVRTGRMTHAPGRRFEPIDCED